MPRSGSWCWVRVWVCWLLSLAKWLIRPLRHMCEILLNRKWKKIQTLHSKVLRFGWDLQKCILFVLFAFSGGLLMHNTWATAAHSRHVHQPHQIRSDPWNASSPKWGYQDILQKMLSLKPFTIGKFRWVGGFYFPETTHAPNNPVKHHQRKTIITISRTLEVDISWVKLHSRNIHHGPSGLDWSWNQSCLIPANKERLLKWAGC